MISAKRIDEILMDCLFKSEEIHDGKIPENNVIAEGITMNIGLHRERLESYREEVKEFLAQLPSDFFLNEGGGTSFLQACVDKDGDQWGEHHNMEQLFLLGQALGYVKCLLPRTVWPALPGGMPYYQINLENAQ